MVDILPAGTWGTWASLFFFLAALFGGDLLALRGCLMLAYVFLLINGATGLPSWSAVIVPGRISLDMICWSVAAGVLHAFAVYRMIADELPVRFASEDERQLARFFNRRSGMEPLEAREVLRRGSWVRVPAGQRVVSSTQLYENVYLLVEGVCGFSHAPSSPSGSQDPTDMTDTSQPPDSAHRPNDPLDTEPEQQFILTRTILLPESLPESVPEQMRPSGATPKAVGSNPFKATAHTLAAAAAALTAAPAKAVEATRQPHGEADSTDPTDLEASAHTATSSPRHAKPNLLHTKQHLVLRSGTIFSLSALNIFGVYIGFDQLHASLFEVWADTDCLLFSWPMAALEEMATACSPSVAAYWRNFITYSIASQFEHRSHTAASRCSTGACEGEGWLTGGRSRDFTDAPRPYERPARGLSWAWFKKALSPFPPPGLRHTALPMTGVAARTRAMALAEASARAQVARSRDVSLRLGVPPHLQQPLLEATQQAPQTTV